MRNKITSKIGLKDLGSFQQIDSNKKKVNMWQATELEFYFLQRTENELVIGDDDKHLNVTLSIYKNEKTQVLTITTVVHIKIGLEDSIWRL